MEHEVMKPKKTTFEENNKESTYTVELFNSL